MDKTNNLPKGSEKLTFKNDTLSLGIAPYKAPSIQIDTVVEPGGILPTQGHEQDVAVDLYTNEDALILPNMLGAKLVGLGIRTQFTAEIFGLVISPRSMMSKLPLALGNSIGVIEGTYTGEIKVALKNTYASTGYSNKVLVYDEDKKQLVSVYANTLAPGLIEEANSTWKEQKRLLGVKSNKILSLSELQLPVGTLYLPKGTRIVQGFLIPRYNLSFNQVEALTETARGAGGFGSTGSTK